ncbi:DNA polymerase III subunit gamma/tau [Teredinibacter turnerae]|uniref:DNA polymerase III subunit gamma/tau n=1 Tax=Teredinibacter turnerae TaxID=2426 RepID=UPI000364CBC1|nr:DNA polymerase III subunit gamma/tau [Teredinibacter turnerae]
MSYQVLARKWRPANFREMVGQEHVLRALINALDHNRLHHAYLFTGTRGVGKTTIARILAKCLNCDTGVTSTPCGECTSCVEIAEGRFVDLIEVDAASRTKVEDTRELLDNVQYAPTRGRYKIYLIDEVHMLSNHSFNALLKTLEEPPEHVKFLLATTDPQKLPVTILSRCLQFNLKNMSPERIVGHLQNVLEKEAIPSDNAALWSLARAADGSMRDALSLTDQAIAFGSGKVADSDVAAMLGTIDHQLIQRLIGALIESDGARLLNAVAEFAEHAPDFDAALSDLLTMLHRIAIAQALPEALDNSFGDRAQVLDFAARLTPEDVQLFYQTALIGRRDLPLASDSRSGFEMSLLRMLAFRPQGLVDVPANVLPAGEAPASLGATDAPAQENAPAKKSEPDLPVPASVAGEPIAAQADAPAPQQAPEKNNVAPESLREPIAAPGPASEDYPPWEEAPGTPVDVESLHLAVASDATPLAETTRPAKSVPGKSVPGKSAAASIAAQLREQVKEITGAEGFSAPKRPPADSPAQSISQPQQKQANSQHLGTKVELQQLTPDNWVKVFRTANIRGIMQSTAANVVLLGREENHLLFALDESRASLYDSSHAQRLADLLSDYFGMPVKVDIQLQSLPPELQTPAQIGEREKRERYENALESLAADPVVQTLQSVFGATLNEGSVTFPNE